MRMPGGAIKLRAYIDVHLEISQLIRFIESAFDISGYVILYSFKYYNTVYDVKKNTIIAKPTAYKNIQI